MIMNQYTFFRGWISTLEYNNILSYFINEGYCGSYFGEFTLGHIVNILKILSWPCISCYLHHWNLKSIYKL